MAELTRMPCAAGVADRQHRGHRWQLLATEGAPILRRGGLAQTHRLQGLSALDVIRKCPPDLCDKLPPVLRVSHAF
jgi:hypothetical protein